MAMEAVVAHLKKREPTAAAAVKSRYALFQPYARDPQRYGAAIAAGLHAGCRNAALSARQRVVEHVAKFAKPTNTVDVKDEAFFAEMNASVVVDAGALLPPVTPSLILCPRISIQISVIINFTHDAALRSSTHN